MKFSKLLATCIFIFSIFYTQNSIATVYLSWDAEEHPCDGTPLPNPPFKYTEAPTPGYVVCAATPNGNRFFEWSVSALQTSYYTEVSNSNFPITNIFGKTFYLAYYVRVTRIGGVDVWHLTSQSADKNVELYGRGLRIIGYKGHWEGMLDNQSGRWTVWAMDGNRLNDGNPSWEPLLQDYRDALYLNQNGFSSSKPIQLEYEKWHSYVLKVKVNSQTYAEGNVPDGEVVIWVNGTKILEYKNLWVASGTSPSISRVVMGGTIAQPYYDAPPHKQQFDALILTDNWQDIINGGYMSANPAPAAPTGLRIIPSSN